MLFTEYYLQS